MTEFTSPRPAEHETEHSNEWEDYATPWEFIGPNGEVVALAPHQDDEERPQEDTSAPRRFRLKVGEREVAFTVPRQFLLEGEMRRGSGGVYGIYDFNGDEGIQVGDRETDAALLDQETKEWLEETFGTMLMIAHPPINEGTPPRLRGYDEDPNTYESTLRYSADMVQS